MSNKFDEIVKAYSKVYSNKRSVVKEDLDSLIANPRALTPEVVNFVLDLMAKKENMSKETYLKVAKQALAAGDVDYSEEELAEKMVKNALDAMPVGTVDKIYQHIHGK